MANSTRLQGNISSRFSGNSEADASELPENLEEMLPRYDIDLILSAESNIQ